MEKLRLREPESESRARREEIRNRDGLCGLLWPESAWRIFVPVTLVEAQ